MASLSPRQGCPRGNGQAPAPNAAEEEMTLLDHALAALARGFHIFPCKPRSKHPAGEVVPNGVKDATHSEAQVRSWWERNADYNIGVALGPSNITVLDLDKGVADLAAAREWCRRNH